MEASFPPGTTSGPGLLPRAVSGSVALPEPRSVLISMAPGTLEGRADPGGLGCHMGPCCCSWGDDDLSGLHSCPGPRWHPGRGPCLGL